MLNSFGQSENTVTKEEIAQNDFDTMFSTFSHRIIHSIIEIFHILTKYVQSRLLQNCRMRERVKSVHLGSRRPGLDPRSGHHSKYLKNGSNGFTPWGSQLRVIMQRSR